MAVENYMGTSCQDITNYFGDCSKKTIFDTKRIQHQTRIQRAMT